VHEQQQRPFNRSLALVNGLSLRIQRHESGCFPKARAGEESTEGHWNYNNTILVALIFVHD
jgi:hypothetical protein